MVAIYDLTAQQLTNAQAIYRAALPYGRDAVMAALMTAGAESSWLRYANNGKSTRTDVSAAAKRVAAVSLTFDHDAVAGEAWTTADSVGLFQQRPMFGYGPVADLMDPTRSTIIFLTGNAAHTTRAFMDAPAGLTLAQRCQWTQGSEFPTGDNYAPFENVAAQLIERFAVVDIPTSPIPSSATGAGATVLEIITMALTPEQQKQLDDYAQHINELVTDAVELRYQQLMNRFLNISDQINDVHDFVDKKVDTFAVGLTDDRLLPLAAAVDALSAKVDALGAALDAKK